MAQEKTFDKAELIKFYDDGGGERTDEAAQVGVFKVIAPGDLYGPKTDTFPVVARTQGLHCERYGFAVILRTVEFPLGGWHYLPKDHPLRVYRTAQTPEIENRNLSAAELARWAVMMADDWRAVVAGLTPPTIDLRGFDSEDTAQTGTTIDDILQGGE